MYIASNEARAEALAAARIEVDPAADVGAAGGRVMSIRSFDPVTQLITATLDYIATGQAQKPPLGDAPVSLFEHLIPRISDQNPCAHDRSPIDMMRHG